MPVPLIFMLFCNLNLWHCSLGKDILKKSENMIFWGRGKDNEMDKNA